MKEYPILIKVGTEIVRIGTLTDGRDKIYEKLVKHLSEKPRLIQVNSQNENI